MSYEFITNILPPARIIRCPVCNKRWFSGVFQGFIYKACPRCKTFVALLDGEVAFVSNQDKHIATNPKFQQLVERLETRVGGHVQQQKLDTKASESRNPKEKPEDVTAETILAMMEARWTAIQKSRPPQTRTVAVGKRFEVFMRDGFRCQYCGKGAQDGAILEVDHRHPRSLAGTDEMVNLVTACWECNRGKSDKIIAS